MNYIYYGIKMTKFCSPTSIGVFLFPMAQTPKFQQINIKLKFN